MFKNRELTKRECIELIKKEIKLAQRLGFKILRLVSMVPAWILEPCLPTSEKYDVCMCIEIHAGLGFGRTIKIYYISGLELHISLSAMCFKV